MKAVAGALVLSLIVMPAWAAREETPQPQAEVFQPAPFDGTWQGNIAFDKEAFLTKEATPPDGEDVRIEISGPVVRVFVKVDGSFGEDKPGAFHIAAVSTNAVIFATDAAPGVSWVETQVFAVTQKDPDTLIVEYARLVNNTMLPPSAPEARYATRGVGELKRVTR